MLYHDDGLGPFGAMFVTIGIAVVLCLITFGGYTMGLKESEGNAYQCTASLINSQDKISKLKEPCQKTCEAMESTEKDCLNSCINNAVVKNIPSCKEFIK